MGQILIKPLLTEKTSDQAENNNAFVFLVDRKANKIEVKKAVEKTYGVTVNKVNTVNVMGKRKVRMTRSSYSVGRTNHFKKAVVYVAAGDTIDLYANI
ncbi:50S ribosomal protein L23 [Luteibaculum oceani]|uniref:Large ribosomal subunit protein uL23 n=1 Tax=Luteibaculum oceani TaxID=1294296 RepID=A0A5C6UY36_9FLAO|nr:50S ribosomal protein L23 [Luteibaculum oceani]TXC78413.1 50S ribosomal protein L23 [Luteibaculum oceani]